MAIQKSELTWHIVTGSMEIEEFLQRGLIKPYETNKRHELFLTIKYPNDILYRGAWGAEVLHYDRESDPYLGRTGKIYCTYDRYKQIAHWILEHMFAA